MSHAAGGFPTRADLPTSLYYSPETKAPKTLFLRRRLDHKQRQLNAAADAARDVRDWVAAASLYEIYLSNPIGADNAAIWIQLGHARKESGNLASALEAYRHGIRLRPGVADSHLQLGHLLKVSGHMENAIQAYRVALRLDPDLVPAQWELSRLGDGPHPCDCGKMLAYPQKDFDGVEPGHSSELQELLLSDPDLQRQMELILASPLFDPEYYSGQSGAHGTTLELARHYLSHGEQSGLKPSAVFDPAFYALAYPGLQVAGVAALATYLDVGKAAGHYVTRVRLSADLTLLAQHRMVAKTALKVHNFGHEAKGFSALEQKLLAAQPVGVSVEVLEEALYGGWYPEATTFPGGAIMHFLKVGRFEGRIRTMTVLEHHKHIIAPSFDAEVYCAQLPADERIGDPLTHYVLHGARRGYSPAPNFSPLFYLSQYSDLGAIEPFVHFIEFGQAEGRSGTPDFTDWYTEGNVPFDRAKRTILIACHEASRTGAPLLGLSIGKQLSAHRNVIFFLPRGGEILEEFVRHSCLLVSSAPSPVMMERLLEELRRSHRLEAVICNSVVVGWLAGTALSVDMPSVALLHEFTEYTASGLSAATAEAADCVVVPANIIRDSLLKEVLTSRLTPPNNIVVRPQGCLPDLPKEEGLSDLSPEQIKAMLRLTPGEPCRIVMGAGYAQIRKGVDLFVQAAAAARALHGDAVRFMWVGHHDPVGDFGYSVWVDDMVQRLGVEDIVVFIPPQSSLDAVFGLADVFFLPSRLDPFPNVVLDAFRAGKPVVCFEKASGFVPYLQDGSACGAAVPFCDVPAAAAAIVKLFANPKAGLANQRLAGSTFDFVAYCDFLLDQVDLAMSRHEKVVAVSREIEAAGWFDAEFIEGRKAGTGGSGPRLVQQRRAIRTYVARGLHNMTMLNPRPGFNERRHWAAHRWTDGGVGLAPAPGSKTGGSPPRTHLCIDLDESAATVAFTAPVAIHLHLHYPELAAEMRGLLEHAQCRADLFITTTSDEKMVEVRYAFRKYQLGKVTVILVPNRGRDIGPFAALMGERLTAGGYGLVGHFHGKQSLAVAPGLGASWRNFLLGSLLGSAETLRTIQAIFADMPSLGLVFAEDRHTVGWTKNKPFAEALVARLDQPVPIPHAPVFPIGTMFWARPEALSLLWQLHLTEDDYPLEPTPNDGTILHAMERMLPSFCEAAGFTWCTVYRNGVSW